MRPGHHLHIACPLSSIVALFAIPSIPRGFHPLSFHEHDAPLHWIRTNGRGVVRPHTSAHPFHVTRCQCRNVQPARAAAHVDVSVPRARLGAARTLGVDASCGRLRASQAVEAHHTSREATTAARLAGKHGWRTPREGSTERSRPRAGANHDNERSETTWIMTRKKTSIKRKATGHMHSPSSSD